MIAASNISLALGQMKAVHNRLLGERDILLRRREAILEELLQARADIEQWELVAQLLALTSEASREQIRARLESTVTAALQTVFGEGIAFKAVLGTTGGQPSVEWQVVSQYADATFTTGVEDARGGGVVDVISLALRLALLEIYRPQVGGPLVLDESGKHLSAEYAVNLARFLQAYSQQTGRQIIMVTHNSALAECADKSFRVALRSGTSEVAQG